MAKMPISHASLDRRIDKYVVMYSHHGLPYSSEREEIIATCFNVDEA